MYFMRYILFGIILLHTTFAYTQEAQTMTRTARADQTYEDLFAHKRIADLTDPELMDILQKNIFADFAGEEKISQFPQPISLKNVPRGMIAEKGKMFIYAPWGNFGFFYKTHGKTVDNSLIELGEVESGIEHLSNMKTDFSARIEICENNPAQ